MTSTGRSAGAPPDIVLIMTDQHRAGFTAGSGLELDTMPTLDRIARDGVSFTQAYTSYPACVPARTSLLTGRFPTAHKVRQNSTAQHAYYSADLVDVLRGAGYHLAFSGKPHMHRGPEDFDEYAGPYWHASGPQRCAEDTAFDAWLDQLDHGVHPEPTPFPLERQLPYRIVSDAVSAVKGMPVDRPSFLWVSFPEPHNPYQVPEPYFSLFDADKVPDRLAGPESMAQLTRRYRWLHQLVEEKRPGYDEGWRRYRANYLGMLRLIDDQIARLLATVESRGEETVIIFVSDHGDYVGEYGLQRKGAGMSDFLMRIPLVFSGGGSVSGQQRQELVSIVDLLPTVCELVGADIPPGVQGRSLAPLLHQEPVPAAEFESIYAELGYGGISYEEQDRPALHFSYDGITFDELNSVTQSGGERMVRVGDHKLIMDDRGTGQLFNLAADPAELDDKFDDPDYGEVRNRLLQVLVHWMIRVADDLPEGAYLARTAEHNWRWAATAANHPASGGSA